MHSSLICSVERCVKYYGVAIKHLLEASRRHTQKPFEPELAMSLERMRMVSVICLSLLSTFYTFINIFVTFTERVSLKV